MKKDKTKLKPINKPIYRYPAALYHAFYSRQLYVDVGKRWRGLGFIYLLLVVALFSIPFALSVSKQFNGYFNEELIEPLLKLPTLYVQNGEASIDQPVPYLIKNKKGQVVIIVDTSNVIHEFNAQYPYLNILINKNQMMYKMPVPQLFKGSTPSMNVMTPVVEVFNKGVNSVFDGKKLVHEGSLTGLKYVSQLMIYPLTVAILFSFFLVIFPMVALLAQVFARLFFSFQITYGQACRVLIVSSTPMLLVLFFFLTCNLMFSGMGIILMALMGAYYSYALHALKSDSLKVVI